MFLFCSIFSVTQSMGVGGFLPTLYMPSVSRCVMRRVPSHAACSRHEINCSRVQQCEGCKNSSNDLRCLTPFQLEKADVEDISRLLHDFSSHGSVVIKLMGLMTHIEFLIILTNFN